MTNKELFDALQKQGGSGASGNGGAGYNPSNDVNSEIYNINTGGYRNNPNQSYIDFGNSGVLSKQDWLNQNPNYAGGGVPTAAVDSAYNSYASDFAKQNGFENLDVSDWEKNRDAGNAWNEERSKMSDEEQVYSYLQGLVDDGKISKDDATYISRYIYGQDAAGNNIDYASGWAGYSEKNNRGGFSDYYDAQDQADAIMQAFNSGEFKNPSELYDALDEWTSHHDEDMVTAMIQMLDNELAQNGWNLNLYDNYLPHWYDDVEVTLDGEGAPTNEAPQTNTQTLQKAQGDKATLETKLKDYKDGELTERVKADNPNVSSAELAMLVEKAYQAELEDETSDLYLANQKIKELDDSIAKLTPIVDDEAFAEKMADTNFENDYFMDEANADKFVTPATYFTTAFPEEANEIAKQVLVNNFGFNANNIDPARINDLMREMPIELMYAINDYLDEHPDTRSALEEKLKQASPSAYQSYLSAYDNG